MEQTRAERLTGDGPVYALYATITALIDTSRQQNRQPSLTEQAMIRGLRRQTYAMFEADLAQRRDPGADTEAAHPAGLPTDDNHRRPR